MRSWPPVRRRTGSRQIDESSLRLPHLPPSDPDELAVGSGSPPSSDITHRQVWCPTAFGGGVIGNTAGSGPVIGGSSPPPRATRQILDDTSARCSPANASPVRLAA